MTRPVHSPRLVLALLGAGVLTPIGSLAMAQGPAAAPPPSSARGGPIQDGLRVPIPRGATAERERAAGVARPREQEAEQLRDLNALSRQLAPTVPLPAPGAAPGAAPDPAARPLTAATRTPPRGAARRGRLPAGPPPPRHRGLRGSASGPPGSAVPGRRS